MNRLKDVDLSREIEPEEVDFQHNHATITTIVHRKSGLILLNFPSRLGDLEALAVWNLGREAAYGQAWELGVISGTDDLRESLAGLLGVERKKEEKCFNSQEAERISNRATDKDRLDFKELYVDAQRWRRLIRIAAHGDLGEFIDLCKEKFG